jgi:hypothetical protein
MVVHFQIVRVVEVEVLLLSVEMQQPVWQEMVVQV